jgi:dienelactone hydrolase
MKLALTLILVLVAGGLVACGPAMPETAGEADSAATTVDLGQTAAPAAAEAGNTVAAPAGTATPAGEAPLPTRAIPLALHAEDMTIEGAGGLAIAGTLTRPAGDGPYPGVILLHMLGSDRSAWEEVGLTGALAGAGFAVLAVDLRGHGETGGVVDWELAPDDLARVWEAYAAREDVDEMRTAVVGASIGSNLALRLGADIPEIGAVVLLSPGLDYRGVTTNDQMDRYGERPVMLVASQDDPYSAASVDALAESAEGDLLTQIYSSAGHGTAMVAAEPDLTVLIVEWLSQYLMSE